MKEFDPSRLTTQTNAPTLKSEGNIMADGPRDVESGTHAPQVAEQPSEAALKLKDRILAKRKVTPEQIESAKNAWDEENKKAKEAGKPLSTDIATQRIYIESGVPPHRTPEYVRPYYEGIAKREGRPLTEDELESIALGIPPISGASTALPPGWTVGPRGELLSPAGGGLPTPAPIAESVFEKLSYRPFQEDEQFQFLTDPQARDDLFNKFFDLANATPHEEFNRIFSSDLGISSGYRGLMSLMDRASVGQFNPNVEAAIVASLPAGVTLQDRVRELKADYIRYKRTQVMKESMHNIRIIYYVPSVDQEALDKSLQNFSSEYGDIALRYPGVLQMRDVFIDVLRDQVMQNRGRLPPEVLTGKVSTDSANVRVIKVEEGIAETETKRRFMERVRRGLVAGRDEDTGQEVQLTEGDFDARQLQEAYVLATGMLLIDQRVVSVAAESVLPEDAGQYISPYFQDVLKSYSPFRHLLAKFQIYRTALAPLLYKVDEVLDKTLGFLKRWNPSKFHEIWEKFEDDQLSIVQPKLPPIGQPVKGIHFIMKQNPFRGGDVWTYLSWRVSPKKSEYDEWIESVLKGFATKGEVRMKNRWNTHHAPAYDVYDDFIKDFKNRPANKQRLEKASPDKKADVEKALEDQMKDAWLAAHPNTPEPKEYQAYVQEYVNWIGTGIRFEKLRGKLDRFNLKESLAEQETRFEKEEKEGRRGFKGSWKETSYEAKARRSHAKDALSGLRDARKILRRMTEIQPQRLYRKSPEVRRRINLALGLQEDAEMSDLPVPAALGLAPGTTYKQHIEKLLDNLSMVESAWLKDREGVLQRGETFDHVEAPQGAPPIPDTAFSIDQYIDQAIIDPDPLIQTDQRTKARAFITAFTNDWANNQKEYEDEFVRRRDYTHGWVLWAEDAPVNEFNFSTIGTTAGFARKARDNDNLKKAGDKLIDLLGHLPRVNEPEELIDPMKKVWTDVSMYDSGKADAFIADLTEGLDKTFAGDWRINIPVVGEIGKRVAKWSYARLVFDRSSPLWSATKMRHFHALLRKDQQMSPEQQKELNKNLPSSKAEVALDVGETLAQLILLAVIFYMVSKILKEKKS